MSGMHKLDALTRILEAETFDGMLVFTRTKQSTVELAEKLEARGFAAAPLNGDIPQSQRERTVARLKAGQIDILVATDVAARGLDVERISHVVNYDVPYDSESYVHRIGRTGRAGRKGEAILFIAPRERNMLRVIERATRQTIEPMNLPTVDAVNALRIAKFKLRVSETVAEGRGERISTHPGAAGGGDRDAAHRHRGRARELGSGRLAAAARVQDAACRCRGAGRSLRRRRARGSGASGTRCFAGCAALFRTAAQRPGHGDLPHRGGVGARHQAGQHRRAPSPTRPGIEGVHIGRVDIREDHSFVDLPEGMPKPILRIFKRCGSAAGSCGSAERRRRAAKRRHGGQRRPRRRGSRRADRYCIARARRSVRANPSVLQTAEVRVMGKGMERKKEEKKKPTKTLEEKRAAKKAKKEARG